MNERTTETCARDQHRGIDPDGGTDAPVETSEIRPTPRQWIAIFSAFPVILGAVVFVILGLTPNIGWAKAGRGAAMIIGGLLGLAIGSLVVFALFGLTLRYVYRHLLTCYADESATRSRRMRAAIVYVTVVSVFASGVSAGIGIAGSALASEGIARGTSTNLITGGIVLLFGYGFLFSGIMGALSGVPISRVRRTIMGMISIGVALVAGMVATVLALGTVNTIYGIAGGAAAAFVVLVFAGRSPEVPQR